MNWIVVYWQAEGDAYFAETLYNTETGQYQDWDGKLCRYKLRGDEE